MLTKRDKAFFLKRLPILLMQLPLCAFMVVLIHLLGPLLPKVRIVKCPSCGSSDFIPIGHELPLSRATEEADHGDFGGQVAFEDAPNWECRNCRTQFS